MEIILLLIIFVVLPAYVNYRIAKDKNRNRRAWLLMGIVFSWWSTIILAVLTKKSGPVIY